MFYTKWLYFICLLLKCNCLIAEEIIINDDNEQTYTCRAYEPNEVRVKLEYGYSLKVTVEEININGIQACGDYLLVKSGYEHELETSGIVFTYKLNTPRTFIVNSDETLVDIKLTNNDECKISDKTICKITFARTGTVQSTTTEEPTTENPWPTPSENDKIYSTVYIAGRNVEDYRDKNVLAELKTAIVGMATQYCKDNINFKQRNIVLVEDITTENVQIYEIKQCPYSWPDSTTCVEMEYKLPIIWSGSDDQYKLKADELDVMWTRYAITFLHPYNLYPYEIKAIDGALTFWYILIAFIIGLGLFLVLFVVLVKYKCIMSSTSEYEEEDNNYQGVRNDSNYSGSERISTSSYITSLPSMFGDDNDSIDMRSSHLMFQRNVDGADNLAYEEDA